MPPFLIIALGLLCTGVNLTINGLGVLLPNCLGYALIAYGTWNLREDQRLFTPVACIAIVLAVLTFPDLIRQASGGLQRFDAVMFWPIVVLGGSIILLLALGLFRYADLKLANRIKACAICTLPMLAGAWTVWALIPVSNQATLIATFLVYTVPALYLGGVAFAASRAFD